MTRPVSNLGIVDDARLVRSGVAGDREAFGELVARYQSAVCALSYSACGDRAHSEDLSQEAFLIAWRNLRELKEPARFKSWLYGIARNLNRKARHRQRRDPVADAQSLPDQCAIASRQDPNEQAIRKEEQELVWRTLEQIPEKYREPLVLFYREEQSIERVAAALALSQEAARQRLSRGRRMLQEQVLATVERTLRQTAPSQAFTLAVLGALPAVKMVAGSAAAGGGVALKGSTIAGAGALAVVKGLLAKLLPPAVGMWLFLKVPESRRERWFVFKAWLLLWLLSILYAVGIVLAVKAVRGGYVPISSEALTVVVLLSALGFVTIVGPYAFWMARVQRRIQTEEAAGSHRLRLTSISQPFEYRSRRTLLGLPLVHVRWHCKRDGRTLPAIGWIAAGNRAYGILLASGGLAIGCVSSGAMAIGLVALGGFGIGLFAFGGMAVGIAAMGGFSVGCLAFGGGAIGWLGAYGGSALSHAFAQGGGAIAPHANDDAATDFMERWFFFRQGWAIFNALVIFSWLVPGVLTLWFKQRRLRAYRALSAKD